MRPALIRTRGQNPAYTPLHLVAMNNDNPAIIEVLLEVGADPAGRSGDGETPWDVVPADSPLRGTDAYWRLNDGRFR